MTKEEYEREKQKWFPVLLLARSTEGSERSRHLNTLAKLLKNFVLIEASKYSKVFPQFAEDFVQAAYVGLMIAVDHWDENKSLEFPLYARFWMKSEFIKLIRIQVQGQVSVRRYHYGQKDSVKYPTYTSLDSKEDDIEGTRLSSFLDLAGLVDRSLLDAEVCDMDFRSLTEAIESLNDVQRDTILGRLEGKSLRAIAEQDGVSHQAAAMRERKAIRNIRIFMGLDPK